MIARNGIPAIAVPAVLAVASATLLLVPLLRDPGLAPGNDTPLHVGNVVESAYLLQHRLPPWDWLSDIAGGRGGPNFLYYGSLGYVLPSLLVNLGLDPVDAIKVLVAVALVIGGLGTFLWCRHFGGAMAGLAGAVLFLHSPYLLSLAYVRGAYPELLAAACHPVLFLCTWQWCAGRKTWNLLVGGATFALIVSTHTLSLILVTPFVILLGMTITPARPGGLARNLAVSLAVPALGVLLSAPYLASPLFEREKVAIAGLFSDTGSSFDQDSVTEPRAAPRERYAAHGVPLYALFNAKPVEGHPVSYALPGRVQLLALASAMILLLTIRTGSWRRDALAHVVLCTGALLLAEQSVASLAALCVPQIAYLQFPWRFLTLFNIFSASSLAATCFAASNSPRQRTLIAAAVPVASVFLSLGTIPRQDAVHFRTETREDIRKSLTTLDHDDMYFPRGAKRLATEAPKVLLEVPPGAGTATPSTARLNDWTYLVELSGDAETVFHQYHFDGWRATVDGEPITIGRERETGLMNFRLPQGTHAVRVFFTDTDSRRVAKMISLLTWGVVIFACVLMGLRRLRAVLV